MRFQHFWSQIDLTWGHSKSILVEEGRGVGEGDGVVGSLKSEQKQIREAGSQHECTFAFLKKWSFIVILQFFLLIVMAV